MKELSKKAHALADYYHPIEFSQEIPLEEKKKHMKEWWTKHNALLVKYGLNKKHLKKVVNEGMIQFREGALEFFDLLNEKQIPLIILSSSGLGDTIPLLLKKIGKDYKNIYVVSNFFEWDNKGNAVKTKGPIIHSMNKSEIVLENFEFYSEIEDRKNVLLLGDGIGDLAMVKGFLYDSLVKVGFLNYDLEKNLERYKENFDVVITNDSDMNFVNEFLKGIK